MPFHSFGQYLLSRTITPEFRSSAINIKHGRNHDIRQSETINFLFYDTFFFDRGHEILFEFILMGMFFSEHVIYTRTTERRMDFNSFHFFFSLVKSQTRASLRATALTAAQTAAIKYKIVKIEFYWHFYFCLVLVLQHVKWK